MSTAGISSSSLVQGAQYFQDRKSDLQQLGQALQSGDLSGAQQDFSTIQNLAQNGPFGGNAFAVNQRQQDYTAIGQALQSGDIAGAQQAFAQLQSTFSSGHRILDPVSPVIISIGEPGTATAPTSGSSTTTATPTGPVTATPPASAATGPEIAINIGSSSGALPIRKK